jgi:membrane protein DedA with SNARE-associated domain
VNGGLGSVALLSMFGLVLFGSIIPVVPTGPAVSAAAVLARTDHPWEIVLVVLVGGTGAYLGDLTTYVVLHRAGTPLAQRVGWLNASDPEGTLARLRARIEANEVRALLLSRLVPAGRIPVLLAASLGGYPVGRYVTAAIPAAMLWAVLYAAIGALGNSLFPDTRTALVAAVAVAVAVAVLLPLLRRRRR